MRYVAAALFFVLATTCITLSLAPKTHADQNPAPTNVGLYNFSTFTLTTTTSTPILARNSYRAGLILQNQGAVSIVVKPGSAPANATDGIVLTAGALLQINPVPVDALYGESASATAKIVMIENAK